MSQALLRYCLVAECAQHVPTLEHLLGRRPMRLCSPPIHPLCLEGAQSHSTGSAHRRPQKGTHCLHSSKHTLRTNAAITLRCSPCGLYLLLEGTPQTSLIPKVIYSKANEKACCTCVHNRNTQTCRYITLSFSVALRAAVLLVNTYICIRLSSQCVRPARDRNVCTCLHY